MKTSIPYRFTPFVAQLGVEMVRADADHSEIRLVLEDRHLNGLGVAHGGLLMTLLDAAMAAAARAKDPDGHGVVTIEMKTSFLRPAKGVLSAFGFCDHHSTGMAFCRGEVRDAAGRLLAQSMGTFRRMRDQTRVSRPQSEIRSDQGAVWRGR
jgi:uncharacterized protein (TIGR00369 family)